MSIIAMAWNFSQLLRDLSNCLDIMETNEIIAIISKFVTFFDLQVRNQTEIRKLAEKYVEFASALNRVNRKQSLFSIS